MAGGLEVGGVKPMQLVYESQVVTVRLATRSQVY